MKKLIILGAVVALAGCSKKTETTIEPTPTATTVVVPATQAATGEMPGVYEVKMADGTMVTETISADGTYTDVMNGKESKGTWRMDGAKACFDPDGDKPEVCYTSSAPAADGSFITTAPDGTTTTVRKVGAAPIP